MKVASTDLIRGSKCWYWLKCSFRRSITTCLMELYTAVVVAWVIKGQLRWNSLMYDVLAMYGTLFGSSRVMVLQNVGASSFKLSYSDRKYEDEYLSILSRTCRTVISVPSKHVSSGSSTPKSSLGICAVPEAVVSYGTNKGAV